MAEGQRAAVPPLEISLERAREVFAVRGPICDSEGFYQHTGQCWNDSLQMIMLFTDGLKEITQQALLTLPLTLESVGANHPERSPRALDFVHRYLLATRERFVRHYLGEIIRKNTCELNEQGFSSQQALYAIGTRANLRAKGEQAKNAAAAGVQKIRKDYNYQVAGGDFFTLFSTIKIFEPMFRPGKLHVMYYGVNGPLSKFEGRDINELSVLVKEPYIPGDELAIGINIPNHALAFYICGGQQYFYDDNYGPIKFPWKVFLQDYQNGIPGLAEEGGGAAGGGDPAGGAGAPQVAKTMHCAAKVRVRNIRQHNVFTTDSYPILHIAPTRYFTRVSGYPDLVELRLDTPLVLQVGEMEYKILLKSEKLKLNEYLINSIYTYRVADRDLPPSRPENTLFGSRIYPVIFEALKNVDANVFEAHATPEEIAKIPGLNHRILSLPPKIRDSDRIYTKIYPTLTPEKKIQAYWDAIEKDYPLLLNTIYEMNPERRAFTSRRKHPVQQAVFKQSLQVLRMLCERPIEEDKYEQLKDWLTDAEGYEETQAAFLTFCRKAEPAVGEGGASGGATGGGRKTKSKHRRSRVRPRRKTKRLIRK